MQEYKVDDETGRLIVELKESMLSLTDLIKFLNDEEDDTDEDNDVIVYDTCKYPPNGKHHYTIN